MVYLKNKFSNLLIIFIPLTLIGGVFVEEIKDHEIAKDTEYCQFDTFSPRCSLNEVIFIEKAFYGRMKMGKCITEKEILASGSLVHDPKFFGCSVDVTDKLHGRCSFKKECSVKIYDPDLKETNPCLPSLNLHLEASHACLSVYQIDEANCILTAFLKPRYLTSYSLNIKNCGAHSNPWILEAPKGQQIFVELMDNFVDKQSCHDIGITLQDISTNKNHSLCSDSYLGEASDKKFVKSSLNSMKMFVNQPVVKKFVLRIKAEGCLDIIPPEDTWLKRTNNDIVIGCYSSKQTWYLRCENGKWSGSIGNCSQKYVKSFPNNDDEFGTKLEKKGIMPKHQQILAIVSIFGAGVVICCLIICAGAVCAKRYSLTRKGGQLKLSVNAYEHTYNHHTYQPDISDNLKINNDFTRDNNQELKSNSINGNDQTYFVLENEIDLEKQ